MTCSNWRTDNDENEVKRLTYYNVCRLNIINCVIVIENHTSWKCDTSHWTMKMRWSATCAVGKRIDWKFFEIFITPELHLLGSSIFSQHISSGHNYYFCQILIQAQMYWQIIIKLFGRKHMKYKCNKKNFSTT